LIARTIDDIALYRDALLDVEPARIADVPRPPRVAFCRTHLWHLVEPAVQSQFEEVAQKLARSGAKVFELELPKEFEEIPEAHRLISGFEFSRNFSWEIQNHWEQISTTLRSLRIKDGMTCSFERYLEARALAERCRRQMATIQEPYDVLLTACATGEAPQDLNTTGNAKLCLIWTTMHVPAISVPAFHGSHGMPVSVYLIGKRNEDRNLFAVARCIQRALD
jgi:amidase